MTDQGRKNREIRQLVQDRLRKSPSGSQQANIYKIKERAAAM